MTQKGKPRAEYFEQMGKLFAENCTACGVCLQVCPAFPLTKFAEKGPNLIIEKIIAFLKNGELSEEAFDMAYSCALGCSRMCAKACPSGLVPMLVFASCIIKMTSKGITPPPLAYQFIPGNRFNAAKVLPALQIKDSQVRWLKKVPTDPRKADVVFFAGCGATSMPHILLETVEILNRMRIDFVALAGGDLCCGSGYSLVGDAEGSQRAGQELVSAISAFRPKQAVFFCLGCPVVLASSITQSVTIPFECLGLPQFLLENVDKIPFKNSVKKIVTIHDSCILSNLPDYYEISRKLFRSIPGMALVEMEHNRENAHCCGGSTSAMSPKVGRNMRKATMIEAKATGAEVLGTFCSGCHKAFSSLEHEFPFEVKNYVSIVAEAIGVHYEDKYKKYFGYRDLKKVLAESKDYINASDFTLEEIKHILPDYMG